MSFGNWVIAIVYFENVKIAVFGKVFYFNIFMWYILDKYVIETCQGLTKSCNMDTQTN